VVVLLAVALGKRMLGDSGVLITAFLSAFVDVDATTLSSIQALRLSEISLNIAMAAITIGIIVNTAVKAVYVWVLSRRDVAVLNVSVIALISLSGALTYFLL